MPIAIESPESQSTIMAFIMRHGLLRQSAMAARMATPSSGVRSAFVNSSIKATAFHTTTKRQVLPPGPRTSHPTPSSLFT